MKLTTLQKQIVDLLSDTSRDSMFMTCDDIAWELKKHKMHIGKSIKKLVDNGILEKYYTDYSNPKIYNPNI
ncbi:hypothetical protein M0Q50_03560 [bacterium]|jgi:predicted transcriptional regulator|nr:hypothetical protein [bacterium]